VARWLVRQGTRHLLLVSRSGAVSAAARAAIAELEGLGAQVSVVAAHVADREAMAKVIRGVPTDAPITRVFHAAGVVDVTPIEELTEQHFEEVLAAKYRGTLVLDDLTRELRLDEFVCFSSIAGVWGAGRQVAYAAANAFLDAWADAARATGRRVFSIAWGPWADGGMVDPARREELARRGLNALDPSGALQVLEQLLSGAPENATVVDVDWSTFRQGFEAWGKRALLAEIGEASEPAEAGAASDAFIQTLLALAPGVRLRHLQDWLAEQCASILGAESAADLGRRRGFLDLGFDSLMMVELRRRIEKALGHRVSATIAFTHPNIEALARYLLEDPALKPLAPAEPAMQPVPEAEAAPASDAAATDDELIDFINSRFSSQS